MTTGAELWADPRHRWAVYAAITAVLANGHPARERVALALEELVRSPVPPPSRRAVLELP